MKRNNLFIDNFKTNGTRIDTNYTQINTNLSSEFIRENSCISYAKINNLLKLRTHKRSSYTLIEGVVILAVLTILVLGAILAYQPMRAKAYELQEKAIIASLTTALNTYYGKYLAWYGNDDVWLVPFYRLKDNAPPITADILLDENITWGYGQTMGVSPLVKRWYFYCPHYNGAGDCSGGTKGNCWTYYTNDPAQKAGRIIHSAQNGH